MKANPDLIPTSVDWGPVEDDLDAADAYRNFAGRSNADVQSLFAADVLARAQDLRFMPSAPFRYYMKGFCDFVLSESYGQSRPWEVAEAFFSVAKSWVESDVAALAYLSQEVEKVLAKLVSKQNDYGADPDIFGNFSDRAAEIRRSLERPVR